MTPEHTFTLWIAALTALPTIVFTGWIAYWTWRRDQERIIVRKSPVHWETLAGTEADGAETDATLCGVGIVVTNLSLYPVRIVGLGFRMGGKHAWAFDRDEHEKEWPLEVTSHARMVVYANEVEWKRLVDILGHCGRIMDPKFVAVAVTETGGRFLSNRLSIQVRRPFRAAWGWLTGKGRARTV